MRDWGFLQWFVWAFSVPFRSLTPMEMKALPSTETSGENDPAAQRYPSVLLILLLMDCGLDDLGSNPDRGKNFLLSTISTQRPIQWLPAFFYRSCSGRSVVMNTSFYTLPRLRKGGAVPPHPLHASIVCIRTPLPLLLPVPLHLSMFLTTTLSIYQILWRSDQWIVDGVKGSRVGPVWGT